MVVEGVYRKFLHLPLNFAVHLKLPLIEPKEQSNPWLTPGVQMVWHVISERGSVFIQWDGLCWAQGLTGPLRSTNFVLRL